jgi:multicomponent Na+:H+ antiporter subunit D
MLQLLLFSGLAFFLMLPMMKRTLTISLDVDWLYRKLLPVTAREFVRIFSPLDRFLRDMVKGWIKVIIQAVQRQNSSEGLLAQTEHAGHMAQWMVVLLAVYLVLNFL